MSDPTDLAVLLVTATLDGDSEDTRSAKLAAIEEYAAGSNRPAMTAPVAPMLTEAEAAVSRLITYARELADYMTDVVNLDRAQAERLGSLIGELGHLAAGAVRELGEERGRPAGEWLSEWRASRD